MMNNSTITRTSIGALALSAWLLLTCDTRGALAQEPEQPPPEAPAQVEAPDENVELETDLEATQSPDEDTGDEYEDDVSEHWENSHRHDAIVKFGADAYLAPDRSVDAIFAMFGSTTSEGTVRDAVVSMFGDTRVTGPVGDAAGAVFGNTYINSRVRGDAFAIFGDLELGPEADIGGEAAVVGGTIKRDPNAIVRGGTNEVTIGEGLGNLAWLSPWVEHCLILGRPLAFEPGLEWAWAIAFGFLAFYVLLGLMFGGAIERCVHTLETRPGESTLASLVTVFLTPVFTILLFVTVIGIVLVPFFGLALFLAGLFGKAVVFAALGRRITRYASSGPLAHVAFAILIGGLIVTAIYVVPVLGFVAYKLLGILGLGVVVYTLLLAQRARSAAAPSAAATPEGVVLETAEAGGSEPQTAAPAAYATEARSAAYTTEPQPRTEPPLVASSLPRADFWVRMGALLIDAILVGIIANLIPGSGDIWLLALATYGALMWKLKGTTVGGIICNLRVVRLDGREIDWATAIVRALGCFLSMAAVGLGFLWIAFDRERQGWHDKIAGTVVVRVPKPGSLV